MTPSAPGMPTTFSSLLANAAMVFALYVLLATFHENANAQTTAPSAAPFLEQIELTDENAKNALRAYDELRTKYKDQVPAGSDARAFAQALMIRGVVTATLAKHGFSDTSLWYRTLISFILAHNAGVKGNLADMRKSIQQMRDTQGIPEETKQQMIAQMSALIPSEQNVAVAATVAKDPDCARIIADIDG